MRLPSYPNIFCLGDFTTDPLHQPKTAFLAELQGSLVAQNVIRSIEHRELLKNISGLVGTEKAPVLMCCSLGRWDGVLIFNDICVPWLRK